MPLSSLTTITTKQLSPVQLKALACLAKRCKKKDGNTIPFYPNLLLTHRPQALSILHYHKKTLVGFASIFFFYINACEITLMMDPAFRRQGIAFSTFNALIPIALGRKMEKIIVSVAHDKSQDWLLKHGFHYQKREVVMQKILSNPSLLTHSSIVIRIAEPQDILNLAYMDQIAFHTNFTEIQNQLYETLTIPHCKVLIMLKNGIPIGKVHLKFQDNTVFLSDIVVIPSHQGQGFAKLLVNYSLAFAWQKKIVPGLINGRNKQ